MPSILTVVVMAGAEWTPLVCPSEEATVGRREEYLNDCSASGAFDGFRSSECKSSVGCCSVDRLLVLDSLLIVVILEESKLTYVGCAREEAGDEGGDGCSEDSPFEARSVASVSGKSMGVDDPVFVRAFEDVDRTLRVFA